MTSQSTLEVESGTRFAFGDNWLRFLSALNDERIDAATQSLRAALGVQSLQGKTFLDVGSGSGLFSLAARRLGASVVSFDYDPRSAECTREVKQRYFPEDRSWRIEEGSVLDEAYLAKLGQFDVVYSWGVLHHTGDLYRALANIVTSVAPGGRLFIAIYNDQGLMSRYWSFVKRTYNRHRLNRVPIELVHAPYLLAGRYLVRAATGRLAVERGMSLYRDMVDWLGGYPFEVARPEEIFCFYRDRNFVLEHLKTCRGRMGCNEFVFRRAQDEGRSNALSTV